MRFLNDRLFELVDMGHREQEGTVGREWDTFSSLVPTLHGTSFRVSRELPTEYLMTGKLKERTNRHTGTQTTWRSHSSVFFH
jgi:hypothetical protein